MITITQAKNTSDVIEHFKPDVAVGWYTTSGRPLDSFSRDIIENYSELTVALRNIPARQSLTGTTRYNEGAFGFNKTGSRVYLSGVIARSNPMNYVVNIRSVEQTLRAVGEAMRAEGMTCVVLPNISSGRTLGLRTSAYLEIIDRTLYDMDVFVATAVPLDNHGRGYLDITTNPKGVKDPSITNPRKKVIHHTLAEPRGYAKDINTAFFNAPIKASYL